MAGNASRSQDGALPEPGSCCLLVLIGAEDGVTVGAFPAGWYQDCRVGRLSAVVTLDAQKGSLWRAWCLALYVSPFNGFNMLKMV